MTVVGSETLVLADGKSGDLSELCGEMLNAAVMKTVSNFAQRQLAVAEKFFHPFNLEENDMLLNCVPDTLREQSRELSVWCSEMV